jgi:glutamate-1-semialdehyde 2,1-aminomutase
LLRSKFLALGKLCQQREKALNTENSISAFKEAKQHIPGGVNSPVRAFKSVETNPLFIEKAKGSKVWDVDGNEYIDYVGTWGPAILGHANDEVIDAVKSRAELGLSFGAPTTLETELAKKIKSLVPSIDLVRFVSSGTEACMSAIRLARGFTGRDKIIKFEGNYHGHGDMLLVKAGSGVATFGLPDSPGVTKGTAESTLTAPYGDLTAVEKLLSDNKDQVAAIIVEPIVGNAGFINPGKDFHHGLKALCEKHGTLFIFDEVMTGFRVSKNCAQSVFDIKPDLSCFGKVIGGGMPLAAYGGRKDIMEQVAPAGPVYQAGTLSGNPVAVECGLKTLEILDRDDVFASIESQTNKLVEGLRNAASEAGVDVQVGSQGAMFGMYFTDKPVENFEQAKATNIERFKKFFNGMLKEGVYLAPSAFEAGFVSMAHTDKDIEATVAAAKKVFGSL